MKNHYELLSVGKDADGDQIKSAFRREIARYHPDKVAHLGPEFLQIAEARASELTEAYRILSNPLTRAQYDAQLRTGPSERAGAGPGPPPETPPETQASEPARADTPPPSARFREERATRDQFVQRAAITRFRDAVSAALGAVESAPARGFDAGFIARPRRALFGRSERAAHVLARFVPIVDAAAIEETWGLAVRLASDAGTPNVFLMGSGLAPAPELARRIAELRRKSRGTIPVLVPMDVRDWDALVPTEASAAVRAIIEKLKKPL